MKRNEQIRKLRSENVWLWLFSVVILLAGVYFGISQWKGRVQVKEELELTNLEHETEKIEFKIELDGCREEASKLETKVDKLRVKTEEYKDKLVEEAKEITRLEDEVKYLKEKEVLKKQKHKTDIDSLNNVYQKKHEKIEKIMTEKLFEQELKKKNDTQLINNSLKARNTLQSKVNSQAKLKNNYIKVFFLAIMFLGVLIVFLTQIRYLSERFFYT